MTTADTILYSDRLPREPDDICLVKEGHASLGGKGLIPALTLRGLGADVKLLTLIGSSPPPFDRLLVRAKEAFDARFLLGALDHISFAWIAAAEDQSVATLVRVGMLSGTIIPPLAASSQAFVSSTDVIYIACESPALLEPVEQELRGTAQHVVTNVSLALLQGIGARSPALLDALIRRSHTLIMNASESEMALRILGIADWFDLVGLHDVVITHGDKGGLSRSRGGASWQPYRAVESADGCRCVVGAGDAFAGAYMKARFEDGRPVSDSCDFAAVVAGEAVAHRGSGPITSSIF